MIGKRMMKGSYGLVTFGVGMGVAQSLAPNVNFTPLTNKLPVMGSLYGSSMVLDQVHKMGKKYGRKKLF
jgi:hypothetical protein|tara:strand:+ start:547 stop:753 length:207 start_codon:yes stop_codon:yes gene_type:complete